MGQWKPAQHSTDSNHIFIFQIFVSQFVSIVLKPSEKSYCYERKLREFSVTKFGVLLFLLPNITGFETSRDDLQKREQDPERGRKSDLWRESSFPGNSRNNQFLAWFLCHPTAREAQDYSKIIICKKKICFHEQKLIIFKQLYCNIIDIQ